MKNSRTVPSFLLTNSPLQTLTADKVTPRPIRIYLCGLEIIAISVLEACLTKHTSGHRLPQQKLSSSF